MNETLSTAQLAQRWGLNPGTLREWRHQGKGPRFFRPSGNLRGKVLYRMVDIEAWESAAEDAVADATE